MTNPNEHKSHSRAVRQESYNDANGYTHTNVTRTDETVNNVPDPNSYRDGYVQGRVTENRQQEEVLAERDNNNAARGLLLGILVTSLAALTAGAIWFLNQRNEEPAPIAPTIVVPNNKPDPKPSPENKTTIIEKQVPVPVEKRVPVPVEKQVPVPVLVPQQQAPAPTPPAPAPQQNVNITVPSPAPQQPDAGEEPATPIAPPQSQNQRSSTDTQGTQSNTNTSTPAPEGTQSNTDTTTTDRGTSSETGTTSGSGSSTGAGSTGNSAQ